MIRTITEVRRGCGKRKQGGLYLIGGGEPGPTGTLFVFNLINPPVPYPTKVHRTARIVDDMAILSREPMDHWWIGASKEAETKKKGDQWALETFGMTSTARLKTGECDGDPDVDTALASLISKIRKPSARMVDLFRQLTVEGVSEMPRVTEHYASLHSSLSEGVQDGDRVTIDTLLDTQAAIWRIAGTIPPTKRPDVVPVLARMLVLLNLNKDAAAIIRTLV